MYAYLFHIFIRLMLLRLCSQHYFILVMNPMTFYNNNNNNIETKRIKEMTKYRQLEFETRERRPSYDVYVLPVVIGALGGGIKTLRKDLKKVFHNNELLDEVVATMQKTVLMDSESIIRRVMSGLIQGEEDE